MYSVSEAYSKAITADTREMPYRVRLAGAITLDQTKIPSMILNESASGSNGVSIGTANSASLRLTLRDAETIDYNNVLVEPESGLVLPDGSIEWLPLGKFWVTNSSTNNDYKTVTLNCADGMYHLTGEYESELTYPTTVKAVVNEIVAKSGVGIEGLNSLPDVIIRRKPEKMTFREAIGYAAGCCGKNARFNRKGNLEFFWYEDTGVTIERKTQYLNGMTKLNAKPLKVNFDIVGKQETYEVNVISDGSGGVTAMPGRSILEGDTVTLSVVPFSGYELAIITAVADSGTTVTLYKNAEDGYTFIQPDSNVTVTASFRKIDTVIFDLTVRAYDGGNIRASGTRFSKGNEPAIYIKAEEGYELDNFVTTPASVSLSRYGTNAAGETIYLFMMPASDVTITANFKKVVTTYSLMNYVDTEGFVTTPGYIDARNLTTGEYIFSEGDIVEVNFICVKGYAFDRVESSVEMVQTDSDKYQFVMPASNVAITAYFKYAEDESKLGKYSWLALPAHNTPPSNKPYWAVFYKHDANVPTCQRFYLVWFDSWSATGFDSDGYGKRTYNIRFDGYYYCGSKNTGHLPHSWDTSSWSGNGASGSTLEWDSIIGSPWAGNPRYSSNYCLLASNTHLFYNSTLLFQMCANAIEYPTASYIVDDVDVREQGALGYYKCPDTFGTPAPASNWMILNSQSCLLMDVDDGQYTGYGGGWSGLYVVWFDSIAVENIGAVFSNSDEDFYVATVTNGHYASLALDSNSWGALRDIADNQVIGLRNPAISEDYINGTLGRYYFNGILASSCNINSSGTLLRYKNNHKICDCEPVVAEASTFSLRKTVNPDTIIIDSEQITATADGDAIVIVSNLVSVSKDADSLIISIGSKPSNFENVTLSYTNPMLYEKSVDSVASLVQGVTYTPAKVKHRGNPAFQVGDIVTVPDKDGVYHSVLIMQQTLTFGGGMNSEITSPGQTEQMASFSANGPMTTQIKNEVKQSTAELEKFLTTSNSLVFASLQRSIGKTEAKISSIVEWQSEKSATIAKVEEIASEDFAAITSLAKWKSDTGEKISSIEQKVDDQKSSIEMLVENGKVKGSILVEAINDGDSVITLSSNRLVVDSDKFKLSSEGRITSTAGEIGGFDISNDGLFYKNNVGAVSLKVGNYPALSVKSFNSDGTTLLQALMDTTGFTVYKKNSDFSSGWFYLTNDTHVYRLKLDHATGTVKFDTMEV